MGAPLSFPRRPLSVIEYHKMIDAGVFHDDDRLELIEGELIQMAPISDPHIQLVNVLIHVLSPQLAGLGILSPQNPIALPPDSEPEPDITILKPECLRRVEVPRAQDVLLLIEVSATTLAYDRDVKIPLYARHAIPELWIVDQASRSVMVYCDPGQDDYRRIRSARGTDMISPTPLPQVRVSLSELWP